MTSVGANALECDPRACPEDPWCRKLDVRRAGGDIVHTYWVYILASKTYGTLYIGVTNDLLGRIEAHRAGSGSRFTSRYGVGRLVHFEPFADIEAAIQREKSLKRYRREWKINLIERDNPQWLDLYPSLLALPGHAGDRASGELGPRDKPEDDTG
ncbi:MAG: GIY-YIG nuclease family protein [Pseudomonadota bacterium]